MSKKKADKKYKKLIRQQQQQQFDTSARQLNPNHQGSAGHFPSSSDLQMTPQQQNQPFALSAHKPSNVPSNQLQSPSHHQQQPIQAGYTLATLHNLSQTTNLANLVNRNSSTNNNTQPSSAGGIQTIASSISSSTSSHNLGPMALLNHSHAKYGGNHPGSFTGEDTLSTTSSDDSVSVSSCSLNDNASTSSNRHNVAVRHNLNNQPNPTPPFSASRCYLPPRSSTTSSNNNNNITNHVPSTPDHHHQHAPTPAPAPAQSPQKKKFVGTLKDALTQAGVDQSFHDTFAQQGLTDVGDLKFLRDSDYDSLIPALFPRRKLQKWIDDNL